jgi:hypothetical protein
LGKCFIKKADTNIPGNILPTNARAGMNSLGSARLKSKLSFEAHPSLEDAAFIFFYRLSE